MSQQTDIQLTTEANVIGNATVAGSNTADRVRDMLINLIDSKSNNVSPTFTGTPVAPTASPGTNTTQLATTAFTQAAIAALLNSAPGALDTLDELAAALGDDANFATTVTNLIAAKQALVNSATALTDGATIDLTAIKHTLASSSATRTFTISYTGDDITIQLTLSNTSATYTFPATSLCVSEGVASGDNTLALSGVSGDKYIIAIKKVGSAYYVASKNFGQ